MLRRVSNGYELEEGTNLTEEQQSRFETIKDFPAGFMSDYEQYIQDGSFPSHLDEEGNKRDLSSHPMRNLMLDEDLAFLFYEVMMSGGS